MKTDELRKIKGLLVGIFLLLLFAALYVARDLVLPIVFGGLLALTFSPLSRTAARIGIPAPVSAILTILVFTITLAALVMALGGSIRTLMAEAPTIGQDLRFKLASVIQTVDDVREASEEVEKLTEGTDQTVQEVVIDRPGLVQQVASNAASVGTSLIVGLIIALFLLASGDLFYVKLVQSFRRRADQQRALEVVFDVERRISRYLLTITLINAALGVTVALAMLALGVPYPFVWGLLGFLLNYLPFVGGITGTLALAAFSIATFDSLAYALVPPLVYGVLTSVEANVVTPYLVGRRLEMNAVSVLLTVIVWGWLWGLPGALMAVPFLVVFKVVCDNVPGWQIVGNFLGDRRSLDDSQVAPQPAE